MEVKVKRKMPRKNYTLSVETIAKIDLLAKSYNLKNSQVVSLCVAYAFKHLSDLEQEEINYIKDFENDGKGIFL